MALLFGMSSGAFAQGGFEFLTAKAGEYNLWALRLHETVLVSGTIDSMGGNTLTEDDVDLGALMLAGEAYVVELIGGVNDGKVLEVLSAAGMTLTVSETLPADAPVDYAFRRLSRLSERMGPAHVAGFLQVSDFNPDNGDLVFLPKGGGLFTPYFYSSSSGLTGFYNAESGEPEDPVLRYTEAFLYLRRGASDASLVSTGAVKDWRTLVTIEDVFSYVGPVTPASLGGLDLELSLQSGTELTADLVWLQDSSTGGYQRYFYSDGTPPLSVGWREAGAAAGDEDLDHSGLWIEAGMIIQRRGSLPHDVLLVPDPSP